MGVDAELRQRLRRLSADERDDEFPGGEEGATGWDGAETLLARVAWSRLAEPGDGIAGAMLAALGPRVALQLLIDDVSARGMRERVRAAGEDIAARVLAEARDRWLPRLDRAATLDDIDRALAGGLSVVIPEGAGWPSQLNDLGAHAPIALWLRGDPAILQAHSLAVVGARAASGYGTHVAAEIVDGVCRAGAPIVSGAAYGIDAVAHRTALAASAPTVAVLAGGADRAYPAAHDSLIGRIAREGTVCAEMVPGSAPTKWRFRQRNRIIAALSGATLVVEAGVRSGTLNTAGHAAELGRMLGAVPGPVTSAASAGCHRLIREYGASLVTNAEEACELIGLDDRLAVLADGERVEPDGARTPPLHERVLDALPLRGGRDAAEVARRSGLSIAETRGALAELDVLGRVEQREPSAAGEAVWALRR
ncbi:DNA-processing protein DprA [Leucobacter weissii]|uniref:DNA-processing protein DprA n=2 Tax=Leucobacter weissii TaxID=1983706 RepID=A0A939MJK1_9MICO|nr:DNA-processing protein DprA [Leucobacter weissii]